MSGIEVICGSMYSGKSEELLRRLRRAAIAKQPMQVFKPALDERWSAQAVKSRAGGEIEAQPVGCAREILVALDPRTTVVAIDEAQFFDSALVAICQELADRGLRVIVAGLDTDYRAQPFGPMPQLLAIAEKVDKLAAVCVLCGGLGTRTQRLIDGVPAKVTDPLIVLGDSEAYEARCRSCYELRPA